MTVQYRVMEGSCLIFCSLFSVGYLLIHLLYLQLLFGLGHNAEQGKFLINARLLFRERQLFAVIAHSRSTHSLVSRKSLVESIILSFDMVCSDKKAVVLNQHVTVIL
jgi:hypothetical protein